jgi:hypothetical protein
MNFQTTPTGYEKTILSDLQGAWDWQEYLSNKLSFPFMAKRIDDQDKVVWEGMKNDKPFSISVRNVSCVRG